MCSKTRFAVRVNRLINVCDIKVNKDTCRPGYVVFKRSHQSFRIIFTILPGKYSISLHFSHFANLKAAWPIQLPQTRKHLIILFLYSSFLETFWNLDREEITIGVVSVLPTGILVVPLKKVTLRWLAFAFAGWGPR